MPKLSADNLNMLAREARRYLYGTAEPPTSARAAKKQTMATPVDVDKSAFALLFGPENSYLAKSEYAALTGLSLTDTGANYPHTWETNEDGKSELVGRLETIEDRLKKLLAKYQVADGFDIVVVHLRRHCASAGAIWEHAGEVDSDAAICLARASATAIHYDQAAMDAEDRFETAHRAMAHANSGPLVAPPECLECGGTEEVEPGGMGCRRCR